jgi:hypothetical protein
LYFRLKSQVVLWIFNQIPVQRYIFYFIQTNKLPKKDKIQGNNLPDNDKIQGNYNFASFSSYTLAPLPLTAGG